MSRRSGLAEQAGTGMLFLDEIGEIEAAAQAKLLRLIEAREFRRLGGEVPVRCRTRFVFATNRDLEREVAEGRFREDFWFRINVVPCRRCASGWRRSSRSSHYVEAAATRMGIPAPAVAEDVLDTARHDDWRGNVRELVNRVERATALCDGDTISMVDFWPDRDAQPRDTAARDTRDGATLADVREHAEREHIRRTLRGTGGRVQDAADRLGISRTTLWERMRKYGLDDDQDPGTHRCAGQSGAL